MNKPDVVLTTHSLIQADYMSITAIHKSECLVSGCYGSLSLTWMVIVIEN